MSEIAILGVDRNGMASVQHCDAKAWTVEVLGDVTSKFDLFNVSPGPYKIGEYVEICENRIVNNGSGTGLVHVEFVELNPDSTVKSVLCKNIVRMEPGMYGYLERFFHPTPPQWVCRATLCLPTEVGKCRVNVSDIPGDYYYGIKTWGESEDEPVYPLIPGGGELGLGRASLTNNMTPIAITAGSAAALAAIIGLKVARKRY